MIDEWLKEVLDYGAYGFGAMAMYITRNVHNKFKEHETRHIELSEKVHKNEKDLLQSKLDANEKFVDKLEYYNTLNKIDTKLDRMSEKIDNINKCFIDKSS